MKVYNPAFEQCDSSYCPGTANSLGTNVIRVANDAESVIDIKES